MTSFEDFANVCSRIEGISGSLEMTSVVAGFLKEVSDEELRLRPVYHGACIPCLEQGRTRVGRACYITAISKTSSLPVKKIEEFIKDTGDVGKAAEIAITSGKTQSGFLHKKNFPLKMFICDSKKLQD